MQSLIKESKRGASLIMVLFMVTIMVTIVLGISTILLNEVGIIQDISKSVYAFYVADHGIEKTLYYDQNQIPQGATRGFCHICDACPTNGADPNLNCSNCTLLGSDCNPLSCTNCQLSYNSVSGDQKNTVLAKIWPHDSDPLVSYLNIVSTGMYKDVTRVMELNTTTSASLGSPLPPPTSCLAGYWKLDEDPTQAGPTIMDSSGNDITGTPHGSFGTNNLPQPSTDVPFGFPVGSRSLNLDEEDDYVNLGNSPILNPTDAISVAFWTKIEPSEENIRGMNLGRIGYPHLPFNLFIYNNSDIFWYTGSASSFNNLHGQLTIVDAQWHQVTAVWKPGIDEKKIYVDGVQIAQGTFSDPALTASNYNVTFNSGISQGSGDGSPIPIALIDDVRIYSCALTAAEVGQLQIPGNEVNPGVE